MPPNTQVDQFVKISQTIKRRLEEDTPVPPKKVCQTFPCKEVAEDSRPPSTLEDPLLLPLEACSIKGRSLDEENKENFVGMKTSGENPNFDSILAKTLLAAREKSKAEDATTAPQPAPKVIVEHQPLPSIYELGQVTRDLDNTMLRSDESESDDSDEDSSMFDQPPPACSSPTKAGQNNFPDRFWASNFSVCPAPAPPPSPVPTVLQPATPPPPSATYQFLDQSNPRIECDENGKSYLQLGTFNHHLPVTPIIQPKPTTLTPRRPIHPFRPAPGPPPPHRPPNPTPPCDHSACLGRKNSPCYRQQRSRMLNVSLHKLHMARQRTDSNLCRSVLICNMLRYIEEESDQEAREQETNFNQQENNESPYWNNLNNQNINNFVGQSPNPYRDMGYTSESFEPPLKDFNSAFRQTPIPMNTDGDSGLEEDRGINWSSVLSLSSQSDLDPLNNNSFSDSWTASTQDLTDVDLSQHSFDDINWKLTPVTADDVLKAFPNDENLFQCSA